MIWLFRKLVKVLGRRNALILLLSLVATAAIVWGWKYLSPNSQSAQQVSVVLATSKPLSLAEGFNGAFDEHSFTVIPARVSGVINNINVHVGDKISQGDVLAQLDEEQFQIELENARGTLENAQANLHMAVSDSPLDIQQLQAQVAEAQVDYHNAQTNYDRSRALFEAGALAESGLDGAESAMEDAKQNVQVASAKLAEDVKDSRDRIDALQGLVKESRAGVNSVQYDLTNCTVTSPVSGMVIERDVDPGASVSSGSPLFKIADIDDLLFKAQVNQMFLPYLHDKEDVQVVCDNLRGTAINGTIQKIYPVPLDSQSPQYSDNINYEVDIIAPNHGNTIMPGMTGQLVLNIFIPKTIMIPEDALVYDNNTASLFVVTGGLAREKVVKTGIKRGTKMEIVSGIDSNNEVILDPGNLTDGQRVSITSIKQCHSDQQDCY